MTALEQFNALKGTKAYRKDLENILQKAKDENNASLVYRISKTLNAFPDVNRFEIEIISYPEAPQGLSGAQHSGDYKEALDDCGRLRKGWKFVKGNVVKIQKKEKPKKESKPKKETGPVKSKEENNSKKETKKDKKYKFVVITDNRPSRVIAVFSYTNPNIKDLRESFWKNGEGKYYETTEEGLRNYTFGMGVYPFEEAKKHIEEKYTEGKDFIYFIIEKDGGRDEAISLVEKPKKETDKTAIDEIKKIVQERLKNQGKPRLYEVLHLESAKGIFIFSWSDLGNIDGTKKKENALAKGLYQYTFPKFKTTQEKIEFSNQVWYDLLINKSLTLKRKIEEPTLNIINYYLGKNTIEDIERASKKTTEETKPKKGKTPKKETGPVKAKGKKASNFSLLQEPTKVLLKFSKDTDKEYYKKYTDEKGFVGVDFLKDNLKDLKKQAIIDEPQGFINTEDFEKSHKASKIKGIDSLKTIVSKDKLYPYLQCVFIEPDTYVATDALKIVVLNRPKNDGLKTGAFYDPNFKCEKLGGCSKEEFYKDLERGFPNYKGVLFPKPKYFTEWIPLEPLIKHLKTGLEVLTKISGLKRVFTIAIKSNIEEKRFDIKNLLDVLLVLESNEAKKIRIEIFKELGNHPIQIKTDNNNLAVIMPLNPNSERSNVISPLKIAPIQLEFVLNETEEKAPTKETGPVKAKEEESKAEEKTSAKKELPRDFSEDLDYKSLYNSYSMSSFDPERRAENDKKMFGASMLNLYNSSVEEAKENNRLEEYNQAFERYYAVILKKNKEVISARTGTFSTAVTGRAGIKGSQLRKNEAKQKREYEINKELIDYIEKAEKKLNEVARNPDQFYKDQAIKSTDKNAIEKLNQKIELLEAEKDFIKRSEKACKEYQKTEDFSVFEKYNIPQKEAKEYVEQIERHGLPLIKGISSISAEIRRVKERITLLEKSKESEDENFDIENGRILVNKEAQRVQIFFDNIPDANTRDALKKRAFKWAPSAKAWQRTLTGNAIDAVKYLIKDGVLVKKNSEKTGLNAPITEVSTERFKNMKVSELRAFTLDYYLSHLKGKKVAIKNHLKEVVFTTKAGRKIAKGEAMYSEKAAVIEHLEELIKNSTYNNWGDRKDSDGKDVLGYLNFKSKITIDGEKRHLRIAISVDNERNLKLKSYDIGKEKSELTHKGVKPSSGQVKSLSEGKDTKKSLSRKEKDENLGLNAPRHEGILKEALTEKGKLKKGWYFQDYGIIDPKGKYHPLEREFAYEYKIASDELSGRAFEQNEKRKQKGFEENIQIENNLKEFFKTLSQKNRKYFKSYKAVEIFYWAFGFEEKPTKFFTIEETNPYNEIQLKVFDKYFSNKNELFTRLENYETLRRYNLTNLGLNIITQIASFLNKEGKKVRGDVKKIDKKYGLNAPRHKGILKEALTEKGKLKKGWYFQDYGIIDPKGEYFTLERETSEEYEIIKKVLDDKNSKINSKINEKIYQKEKQESADRYSKEQSLYLELYEKNNFSKNLTYDYFVFFLSNGMKGFGTNEKYSERSFILNTNSPIQKKYIKTLSENNLVEDIKLVEKKQISGRVHYQYQVFLLSKGISLIKKYIKGYREIYNYDENLKKNKQKYGLSMPFYVQEQEKKEIQPSSNSISNKIKAFQERNFEIFNIENPDLSTFLGEIERKNIGSTVITLTGGAGSGKTRFAFQFMNALAQHYKVGHASLEEHPESKLYFDKVTQYLDSQAQNNISVLENETLDGLENLINENEVIVIDSFAKLREMDSKFLVDKDLRKKYNGKLFLVIFQQTSDGKMRGGSTSEFDGDIILFTKTFDDPKENFVYPSKNRYNALPLSELKYSVFYQQLLHDEEQEHPVTDLIFDVVY